jgi:hypothetical protein
MADIELVIKLDEEYIKRIDKLRFLIGGIEDRSLQINVINAIKNGTPLPKGHGRLIDADRLLEYGACPNDCNGTTTCMESYKHLHCPIRVFDIESINDTPTIIEADKEKQ